MHAAALARQMGISRVMVPREPGLLSAVGTLVAGMRVDRARTVLGIDPEKDAGRVEAAWRSLESEVRQGLEEAGVAVSESTLMKAADLRYSGQSFELTVPTAEGVTWEELAGRFEVAHEERYGYRRPAAGIELVSLRVEGHGPAAAEIDELLPPLAGEDGKERDGQETPATEMYWEGVSHSIQQIHRDDLMVRECLRGPLVIDEFSATTVVPPDAELEVGPYGDLLLTL
jgi:N-methylhydantoinase A